MSTQKDLVNLQAQQLALQAAQAAAQQEFLRMRFQMLELPQFQHMSEMDKERLAFEKATESFNETMKMIQLTGKLPNGQDTLEAALAKAQITGLMDGEETLAAKQLRAQMSGYFDGQLTTEEQQRRFTNSISEAALTGLYNGQFTTAEQQRQFQNLVTQAGLTGQYNGQDTIDWLARQAGITGYFHGAPTLARQGQEEQTALGLANLGAQLSGPADIFKFLRTFAGTPNGMMDILNAVAGRYQLAGFTGGDMNNPNYAPANVNSLIGNILGAGNPNGVMGNPGGNSNLWQTASTPNDAPYGAFGLPDPNAGGPPYTDGSTNTAPNGNIWSQPAAAPIPATDALASAPDSGLNATAGKVANIVNGVSSLNDAQPTAPGLQMHGEGYQAPANYYNYQPTGDGRFYVYPPGEEAPADAMQYSSQIPASYSDLNSYANGLDTISGILPGEPPPGGGGLPGQGGGGAYGKDGPATVWSGGGPPITRNPSDYDTYINNLVPVSKINAENYGNMTTFQKEALQSAYGEKGITPQTFEELFKKSLPRYAGPAVGSFA